VFVLKLISKSKFHILTLLSSFDQEKGSDNLFALSYSTLLRWAAFSSSIGGVARSPAVAVIEARGSHLALERGALAYPLPPEARPR